jgi:murein DD-endopeptidase MepM/ murein hydrolase activator NlpD
MIIPQSSVPTILAAFGYLRRGEITVRRHLWQALSALPFGAATKQHYAKLILRENAQAAAVRTARATFQGQVLMTTPVAHEIETTQSPLLVDRLIDPHVSNHLTITALVLCTLWFGPAVVLHSGLEDQQRTISEISATEMTPPIDAPLPQVLSASELTVPHMVTPLPSALPPFLFYHRIQSGDTLGSVAEFYRTSPRELFWANGLQNGRVFIVGSTLRIPRLPGISHTIAENETVASIAAQYGASTQAITLFKPNRVKSDIDLVVGREVFIPYVLPEYPQTVIDKYGSIEGVATMEAIETVTVLNDETNLRDGPGRAFDKVGTLAYGQRLIPLSRYGGWVKLEVAPGEIGWVKGTLLGMSDGLIEGLPVASNVPWPPPRWVWPSTGTFTSGFGWRSQPYYMFHNGIDLANKAGTSIFAARYGRVIEAGWCRGYGYCVKINHGNGVESQYGHMLKQPVVRTGEIVDMGDYIGMMGSTYDAAGGGYSTGVHLHFTVKVGGKPVDPLLYLP